MSLHRWTLLTVALGGALTLPQLTSAQGAISVTISATNAAAIDRPEEIVTIPWATVTGALKGVTPAGVRVLDREGRELLSQVVDNDGNGTMDEFIFQASFVSKETRRFTLEAMAPAKFESKVFIRHDDPRDDVAWENDRGAWRIYGEGLKKTSSAMSSSGIDVWSKKTRALIVEKWYTKGHDAYHIDSGEGADFFDVGETLGAGGTALWQNDSLFRADNFKAWKIIASGPLRAVFELRYDPWSGPKQGVSEIKRVRVDAGQQLYRQESVFTVTSGSASTIPYVIGLVKRPGLVGSTSRNGAWGWVAGWGPTAPKNGGHGEIGTAVMLPRERVSDWKEAFGHYLAVTTAVPGTPAVHYIGAAWTAAPDIKSPQAWWRYLDEFSQRLAVPIAVRLVP